MAEHRGESKVPVREPFVFLWSHSCSYIPGPICRQTLGALPPKHPTASTTPTWSSPHALLAGFMQSPSCSPCLDPCPLLPLFCTAASYPAHRSANANSSDGVSQLTQSKANLWNSLWDLPGLAPAPPHCSLCLGSWVSAVLRYAKCAPASEGFHEMLPGAVVLLYQSLALLLLSVPRSNVSKSMKSSWSCFIR